MRKYDNYCSTLGSIVSMLTENLNIQMESEFADLYDRKLISLYGMKQGRPTKMDQDVAEAY